MASVSDHRWVLVTFGPSDGGPEHVAVHGEHERIAGAVGKQRIVFEPYPRHESADAGIVERAHRAPFGLLVEVDRTERVGRVGLRRQLDLVGPWHFGHEQARNASLLASGLPLPSGTRSSGSTTGSSWSGTGCTPQDAQWMTGIGQPQ